MCGTQRYILTAKMADNNLLTTLDFIQYTTLLHLCTWDALYKFEGQVKYLCQMQCLTLHRN